MNAKHPVCHKQNKTCWGRRRKEQKFRNCTIPPPSPPTSPRNPEGAQPWKVQGRRATLPTLLPPRLLEARLGRKRSREQSMPG